MITQIVHTEEEWREVQRKLNLLNEFLACVHNEKAIICSNGILTMTTNFEKNMSSIELSLIAGQVPENGIIILRKPKSNNRS